MRPEPSATITYAVLLVGFVLTFSAFVLSHATLADGDYDTANALAVASAVVLLATFVATWPRLHPIMRGFAVFLSLVAGWSLFVAGSALLGRLRHWLREALR